MSGRDRAARGESPDSRVAASRSRQAEEAALAPAPADQRVLISGLLRHGVHGNRASSPSGPNTVVARQLLALQSSHGNRYVQRLIGRPKTTRPAPAPGPPLAQDEPLSPVAEEGPAVKARLAAPPPPPTGPPGSPPAGAPASPPTDGAGGATSGASRAGPKQLHRAVSIGPAEATEEHGSTEAGGGGQRGQASAGRPAAPVEAAQTVAGDTDQGGPQATADGGGEAIGPAAEDAREIEAAGMDKETAQLVADFLAEFGTRMDEVRGPAAKLVQPGMRRAAARLLPDRAEELAPRDTEQSPEPENETAPVQRSPAVIQRQGTGTLPTRKVKVTVPNWPTIPLFKDRNVGSWFLLSGVVESPTYEGTAEPPDNLRDDTTEQELQLTADGKVKGYAATFHKETLAKTGNCALEGKVAVEVTDESVKVSGLTLTLPDLGGASNVLLQGQFDFDLLDWPAGEPPGVMVLSYTQKIGLKSAFTTDGWKFSGQLFLPLKVSIKPNPAKVAQYVARVIGPRVAAAAPAGLAIAAPLVAGGVCLALWIHAIEAGEDMAEAMDSAKENTIGYVTAYFNTIMGYSGEKYSNAGSAQGKAAAQKVLDRLRWNELPAGAQARIRAEYIKEGTMDLPGIQASIWKQYRSAAVAEYRKRHDWDAWAYDHSLPSDLGTLVKNLDIVGPPWPVSAY